MKRAALLAAVIVLVTAFGSASYAGPACQGGEESVLSIPELEICEVGEFGVVPLLIDPADGVIGMNLDISYDPAVVNPIDLTVGALTAADCSVDWTICEPPDVECPATPVGQFSILISLFCTLPQAGSGEAAVIVFEPVGPGISPLTWRRDDLNEGTITSCGIDGQIGVLPVAECDPLLVTMETMSATSNPEGVLVQWVTAMEIDTVAFRVLRETSTGREKRLDIISYLPPAGTELSGSTYEFLDNSREADLAIHYYLEDVDVFGRVTRHGPIAIDRGVRQTPTSRSRDRISDR